MTQHQPISTTNPAVSAAVLELYKRALPSSRSGALYNAFSYPTKISPEAIALYIATHTAPGATVMDTFGGSGTTGLATKLCDVPTPGMLAASKALGLTPVWGPRKAVIYELGCIGSFIATVMCNPPDPAQFVKEAAQLVKAAYAELGRLLAVQDENGESGTLRHAIWSEVLVCPRCKAEHTFWAGAVQESPLRLRPADETYSCPHCSERISVGACERATEVVLDPLLGKPVAQRKRVPVRIYGKTGNRKWQRTVLADDLNTLKLVDDYPIPASVPVSELRLGDLYRSGYHFGITHLHHLYTRRNLICLGTLLQLVEDRPPEVRDALRLLVLSYNQSHSTLMTRVVVKDGKSDFVLTGAQSGVLYISSLPVEKNILEGISRKVKPLQESFALIAPSKSSVTIRNQSSTVLAEPTASVDYCFTDPPFADFIPYSEINQVNELWLGRTTDTTSEAIMSASQGKTLEHYASLMSHVFSEISRTLKPNGLTTVVFHAAKASVWKALQESYRSAGLEVVAASVLDKLQASFKQVVSTVSVKGDPLLLLTKRSAHVLGQGDSAVLYEVLRQCSSLEPSEREPERVYSRYVARCLEVGTPVEMNAADVYARVREATLE